MKFETRPYDLLVAGGLGLAVTLRIFQGGAAADLADPSLNLAADGLLGATLVLAAARAAIAGTLELPRARILVPLAALVLAAWLSLLVAEDGYAAARRAGLFTAAAGLAVLAFPAGARREGARALLATVLAAATVVAGLAWKERLFEVEEARASFRADPTVADVPPELLEEFESRLFTNQVSGPFILPNGLGAFLAMGAVAAGFAAAALLAERRRAEAAVLGGAAALALSGIAIAAQKGSWLGLAAGGGLALLSFASARRARQALVATGLLAAAAVAAIAVTPTEALERTPGGLSVAVRKEYAVIAERMIAEKPLGGVGAGNFGVHVARVKPARAEETRFAHDDYLEALAEMGPLGAGALVAFWVLALMSAFPRGSGPPAERGLSSSALLLGGAVGVLLLPLLGLRYRSLPEAGGAGAVFLVLALVFERSLRSARPRILAAGAAGGAAAFALQAAIDFLHPEHGLLAAAIALAAAAPGLALEAAPRLELRPPPAARAAIALGTFLLFGAFATIVLPRVFADDGARASAVEALRRGDLDEAERALAVAIDAVPADATARAMLADTLAERFRRAPGPAALERALAAYDAATRGRTALADVKARAGLLLRDAHDPRALEWFERAAAAYPTNARIRFLAGRSQAERGARDAARAHLEAALAADSVARVARLRLTPEERAAATRLLGR